MVAGEVESSCQLVVTFFFGLTLPNYRNKSGSAQPPSYQLLPPPLLIHAAVNEQIQCILLIVILDNYSQLKLA